MWSYNCYININMSINKWVDMILFYSLLLHVKFTRSKAKNARKAQAYSTKGICKTNCFVATKCIL